MGLDKNPTKQWLHKPDIYWNKCGKCEQKVSKSIDATFNV